MVRSGGLPSGSVRRCELLVEQSSAHAIGSERCSVADARRSAGRPGRVDWAVAGFLRLSGAGIALHLFPTEIRAHSFVRKAC